MHISSVGAVAGYNPAGEIRRTRNVAVEQQLPAERAAASLPRGGASASPDITELKNTAVDIESLSRAFNSKLQFVVDHGSNEVIVKVVDRDTDKVIRVIPSEELQRLQRRLGEDAGFLLNEQV